MIHEDLANWSQKSSLAHRMIFQGHTVLHQIIGLVLRQIIGPLNTNKSLVIVMAVLCRIIRLTTMTCHSKTTKFEPKVKNKTSLIVETSDLVSTGVECLNQRQAVRDLFHSFIGHLIHFDAT